MLAVAKQYRYILKHKSSYVTFGNKRCRVLKGKNKTIFFIVTVITINYIHNYKTLKTSTNYFQKVICRPAVGAANLPLSAPLSWHLSPRWCHLPSSDGSAGEARSQNQSRCNVGTKETQCNISKVSWVLALPIVDWQSISTIK